MSMEVNNPPDRTSVNANTEPIDEWSPPFEGTKH